MAAESRSLATALWTARFASGFLPASYTTRWDTTSASFASIVCARANAPHATALAISAHFAYCPTFYDEFGYACGYPIYVRRPFPYDASYGIGFRP